MPDWLTYTTISFFFMVVLGFYRIIQLFERLCHSIGRLDDRLAEIHVDLAKANERLSSIEFYAEKLPKRTNS